MSVSSNCASNFIGGRSCERPLAWHKSSIPNCLSVSTVAHLVSYQVPHSQLLNRYQKLTQHKCQCTWQDCHVVLSKFQFCQCHGFCMNWMLHCWCQSFLVKQSSSLCSLRATLCPGRQMHKIPEVEEKEPLRGQGLKSNWSNRVERKTAHAVKILDWVDTLVPDMYPVIPRWSVCLHIVIKHINSVLFVNFLCWWVLQLG